MIRVDSHSRGLPLLSDEAISRESSIMTDTKPIEFEEGGNNTGL